MSEEKLSQLHITQGLTTRFIGQNVLYYPTVTSTNDIARQQALEKAPEGTAVIADRQTAGRGRLKAGMGFTAGQYCCHHYSLSCPKKSSFSDYVGVIGGIAQY